MHFHPENIEIMIQLTGIYEQMKQAKIFAFEKMLIGLEFVL